jgi:hypothetical protein
MRTLLAQSRHCSLHHPLSGVKQTCPCAEIRFAVAIGGEADMRYCSANLVTQSGHSGRKVLAFKSCRVLAGGHASARCGFPTAKASPPNGA